MPKVETVDELLDELEYSEDEPIPQKRKLEPKDKPRRPVRIMHKHENIIRHLVRVLKNEAHTQTHYGDNFDCWVADQIGQLAADGVVDEVKQRLKNSVHKHVQGRLRQKFEDYFQVILPDIVDEIFEELGGDPERTDEIEKWTDKIYDATRGRNIGG